MSGRLFSRFKDYNYILDKMLEEKNFSENAKNLLLSMVYKIENSYKDYSMIKAVFKEQNDFFDDIINSISVHCNDLVLVDPKSDEAKKFQKNNLLAISNIEEKWIRAFPTEQAILYGIADIKPKHFFITKNYDYIKEQFQKILKEGYILDTTEVIRNFNGWSWNLAEDANINYVSNMVYQVIRLLLDEDFLEEWQNDLTNNVDYIALLRKSMSEKYGEECSNSFYIALTKLIFSTSLKNVNPKLEEEYIEAEVELETLNDKNNYIYDISKKKQLIKKEIDKIDAILLDEKKLTREFNARNKKLTEDKKLINIDELIKIFNNYKKEYEDEINELNELEKPSSYEKAKEKMKEKMKIMHVLKEKKTIRQYAIELHQEVIKCFEKLLEQIKYKEEIIELIYKIRYYRKLRVTKKEKIEDIHSLFAKLEELSQRVIDLACHKKIFNSFCKDSKCNYMIIEKALNTMIANYEDVDISLEIKDGKLIVTVYDNEVVDSIQEINYIITSKDLKIKQKRPIPMYVF